MPIYAYRCTTCGHAQDVLRKISDPPLVVCPTCGAGTFVKQVTAAGFQLKGSGWYVTDFRDGKKPGGKPAEAESGSAADAKPADVAANGKEAAPKPEAVANKGDAAPAAASASPAPAASPAPPASSKGES